jgi:hypothetical protein
MEILVGFFLFVVLATISPAFAIPGVLRHVQTLAGWHETKTTEHGLC